MAATTLPTHRYGDYWSGLIWTSILLNCTAINLAGATATFHVRRRAEYQKILYDLRSDEGQITIDTEAGTITVPPVDSLKIPPGNHSWEMELRTSGGEVYTIGYGTWEVTASTARREYD